MAGLHTDDLIMEVNNSSLGSVESFEKQMGSILKAKSRVITFFVLRGAQTHFVFMEPDWSKLTAGR